MLHCYIMLVCLLLLSRLCLSPGSKLLESEMLCVPGRVVRGGAGHCGADSAEFAEHRKRSPAPEPAPAPAPASAGATCPPQQW